jgi:hypothetical protein
MVFSANNQQNDLTFDFNSTLIQTVNTHKYLGVIFSCDCFDSATVGGINSDKYSGASLFMIL